MSEQRRLAVLLARHDASVAPLTVEQATHLIVTDQSSIIRYWAENAENWFSFAAIDFFGSYDVALAPPPDKRSNAVNAAKSAAQAAGVNLAPYDSFIVLLHPGGVGYDAGATGVGPGTSCLLNSTDNRTFFCHETGHVLGFDHTYGIRNLGSDYGNAGIKSPVYGDPYDLMSSAAFGGAAPTFTLPAGQAIVNFPNALSAGPMLSRANLHFWRPGALEATNKVRHIFEGASDEFITLYPAGQGGAGKTELIVFHPTNEDASAHGRVYIEYRQPFDFNWGSRWDSGLSASVTELDCRGLVVHIVKDIPDGSTTAVWYGGRLVFPSPDSDLMVDTSRGSVTVTVSDEFVQENAPAYVRARVGRQHRPRVSIVEKVAESVNVLSSEKRPIPGWEWAGLFTWERRLTVRTVTYTPIVAGLGGAGPTDARSAVKVYWYVGGVQPDPPEVGVKSFAPLGGGAYVDVNYSIDQETRTLTLSNGLEPRGYTVSVQASASDESTWSTPITADTTFSAEGVTEGWGDDYKRFMDTWERITNPIPKPEFGPPKPDDYRVGIDRLLHRYDALRMANPEVAANLQPLVLDQVHLLQRMVKQI